MNPYGLLFTTPDERLRLDNRFSDHGGSNGSQAGAAHTEPQSTRPLKVNGPLVSSVGEKGSRDQWQKPVRAGR